MRHPAVGPGGVCRFAHALQHHLHHERLELRGRRVQGLLRIGTRLSFQRIDAADVEGELGRQIGCIDHGEVVSFVR
jgi:hypothetical protein